MENINWVVYSFSLEPVQGSNSVYKLITNIHFIQYLKHKLPLSPIKAFPAWSSWATISCLVQLAKSVFLISIKTWGVKWWFLIKWVWSVSKEVAEVYGKKHSCQFLQNMCEPGCEGSRGSAMPTLIWKAHPQTLCFNVPPAWTLQVSYSPKLIYLSSFHWKIIKPLGFARDQRMIAPVVSVSKSIASLDSVTTYSDKAALCWKESPQQLWIRDKAMYRKWCTQDILDIRSAGLVSAKVTKEHCPTYSTSGWKLIPSFELSDTELILSECERSSLKPTALQRTDKGKNMSWTVWSRLLIKLGNDS